MGYLQILMWIIWGQLGLYEHESIFIFSRSKICMKAFNIITIKGIEYGISKISYEMLMKLML